VANVVLRTTLGLNAAQINLFVHDLNLNRRKRREEETKQDQSIEEEDIVTGAFMATKKELCSWLASEGYTHEEH